MSRRRRRSTDLALLLATLVMVTSGSACGASKACGLVGCENSLRVSLQPSASLTYQVELVFPSNQSVTFECSSTGPRNQRNVLVVTCDGPAFYWPCGSSGFSGVGDRGASRRCSATGVADTSVLDVTQRKGCPPTCMSSSATLPNQMVVHAAVDKIARCTCSGPRLRRGRRR
jgi:hypothetical protein